MAILDQWGRPLDVEEILAERERQRGDAWANEQTGLGVAGLDKSRAARYLPVWRVLDQELTSMHSGDDLCRKIVGKRAEEMFRRGFEITSDDVEGTDRDELREYATDTLNLETNLLEAMRWGRLYGGALACMDIDDGRYPWEPLDEDHIRSFNSIAVVDRRYAYVQSQYANIGGSKSKYGQAQIYLISNAVAGYGWNSFGVEKIEKIPARELQERGAMVSLWHESRVIRFDGHSADIVTRQQLAGWSWSVLQVVFDAIRQFAGSFDSAGYLLHDASQAVFKLQGLIKAITSGQRGAIAARTQLMEMTRSVLRGVLLDAGGPDGKNAEDFKREPTSFAGVPELLDRMMLRLAAAADMPATELFGRAPAGLNATGEADTRKWYDTIATEQSNVLGPRLKRVFRLLALAKDGPLGSKKPIKWTIKFHPLWSPTDAELATTRKTNADRDVAYITACVVTPEEVAVDLTDVYPNLDVEKREESIKSGLLFNPYENEPAPTDSALIAGKTPGQEPLSPQTPVALYGTGGTQVSAGNYPPVAAATSASHGMQPPLKPATTRPQNPSSRPPVGKSTLKARQAASEENERRKAAAMAPIVKGAVVMAGIGKKTPGQQDKPTRADFDPDQPRAPDGKFGEGGGPSSPSATGSAESFFRGDKGRLGRLHDYTEYSYAKMNEFARDPVKYVGKYGEKEADKMQAKNRAFSADLRSAPKSPGEVHRGVMLSKDALARFQPGSELTARGFWSTTKDPKEAEGFSHQTASGAVKKGSKDTPVVMHITQHSGVELGKASSRPEEAEVIVPHGARMRTDRVERNGGAVHVYLTEVPHAA